MPYSFDHNSEEPKQASKMKPFGGMNNKSKPTFGKPTKPFGNTSNINNSIGEIDTKPIQEISKPEAPKPEPPRQEPLSFSEKYGISKAEEPKPTISQIQPQSQIAGPSKIASNAPWMKNKPTIGGTQSISQDNDYIPTIGGGVSTMSRRIGQKQTQDIDSIPIIGEEKKRDTNIDSIPMIGDSRSNNSVQIDKIPIIGETKSIRSNATNKISGFGDSKIENNQINKIPILSDRKDNQIDNIPTIGETKIGEGRRRITTVSNEETGGYVPSGVNIKNVSEDTGGRKRVTDPFAKYDSYDPTKNVAANTNSNATKPLPFGSNNVSRISNNSGANQADSLFQANKFESASNNKSSQPGFVDRLAQPSKETNNPKKNDFWSDFLNEDQKPKPAEIKKVETKPAPQPTNNKPTFQDVADLEDEFILD